MYITHIAHFHRIKTINHIVQIRQTDDRNILSPVVIQALNIPEMILCIEFTLDTSERYNDLIFCTFSEFINYFLIFIEEKSAVWIVCILNNFANILGFSALVQVIFSIPV